jgi:hypothetical protein
MLKYILEKPFEYLARIFFTIIGLCILFISLFFSFIWDAPYTIFSIKKSYNKYLNDKNPQFRMIIIDLLCDDYRKEYKGYLHEKRRKTT